jgi:hypothetical protein
MRYGDSPLYSDYGDENLTANIYLLHHFLSSELGSVVLSVIAGKREPLSRERTTISTS